MAFNFISLKVKVCNVKNVLLSDSFNYKPTSKNTRRARLTQMVPTTNCVTTVDTDVQISIPVGVQFPESKEDVR